MTRPANAALGSALAISAFLTVLTPSTPACAQGSGATFGPGFGDSLGVAFMIFNNVLSAPPLVANAIYIGKDRRPPLVWPILGYAFGANQVFTGCAYLIPNMEAGGSPTLAAGGAVTVGLGIVNLGLSTWALLLPRARPELAQGFDFFRDVKVLPLAGTDVKGHAMTGFSLHVANL